MVDCRTGCTCSIVSNLVLSPIILLASSNKIHLLRQARHVQSLPSRARAHAHEALLCFPMESFRRCSTPGPSQPRHTPAATATAAVLLICIVLLGAACFFIFCRAGHARFFPVLHLAFRPTITRLQRPHFSRLQAELGSTGGALREEHWGSVNSRQRYPCECGQPAYSNI